MLEEIITVFSYNICSKNKPSFLIFNSLEPTWIKKKKKTSLKLYINFVGRFTIK